MDVTGVLIGVGAMHRTASKKRGDESPLSANIKLATSSICHLRDDLNHVLTDEWRSVEKLALDAQDNDFIDRQSVESEFAAKVNRAELERQVVESVRAVGGAVKEEQGRVYFNIWSFG